MKSKMLGDGDQKWYQSWPVACLSKSESRIKLVEEALERDKAFFGELQCTDTTIILESRIKQAPDHRFLRR